MTTISKPNANPMAALLLTWFLFGSGHYIVNGQTKKWIITLVCTFIGAFLCYLPGLVVAVLSIADSYKTAERLANGEEIGEHEYSIPLLYNVCKILHTEATCSATLNDA